MAYDGTTPLNPAIADLINCSPKNNNKLAKVIGQAKNDLSITNKARKLPTETNQQIYRHIVEIYSQPKSTEQQKPTPENATSPPVEIILQADNKEDVNIISQTDNKDEQLKNDSVEIYSQLGVFDNVRIAFYVTHKGEKKRQVIAVDSFFINALASIGILKKDVPQWVQSQVNDWTAFDSQLPNTRQVKYLIMREVVKELSGSDKWFTANNQD